MPDVDRYHLRLLEVRHLFAQELPAVVLGEVLWQISKTEVEILDFTLKAILFDFELCRQYMFIHDSFPFKSFILFKCV